MTRQRVADVVAPPAGTATQTAVAAVTAPAAGTPQIAANSSRILLEIQNAGTTRVAVSTTYDGAAAAIVLAAGASAADGRGAYHRIEHYPGPVWLVDLDGGAGPCRVREITGPA
jgi:hypothetical protein